MKMLQWRTVGLALLALATVPTTALAQDATADITDVSCEVTDSDVVFTFTVTVEYEADADINVALWPRTAEDGELIENQGDEEYSDPDGNLSVQREETLEEDEVEFAEYTLELPIETFPEGDYEFYPEVEIQDLTDPDEATLIEEFFLEDDCTLTLEGVVDGGDDQDEDEADPTEEPDDGGDKGGDEEDEGEEDDGGSSDAGETVELEAGFDGPFELDVVGGGDVDAFDLNSDCRGYITEEPTVLLEWTGETDALVISFESASDVDTTLVIIGPDDEIYCDDDSNTDTDLLFQPLVEIEEPAEGAYAIHVGTYSEGNDGEGTLTIEEN